MEVEFINSLLQNAEDDLKASKILFRNKLFPQSIFYLQQSIEKGYKAVALRSKHIDIGQLRSSGHNFFRMLKFQLKSMGLDGQLKTIEVLNHVFNENDNADDLALNDLDPSDINKMIFLTNKDISDIFILIKEFRKNLKKSLKHKKSVDMFRDLALDHGKLTEKERALVEEDFTEDDVFDLYDTLSHAMSLQLLGFITCPHSSQARYPIVHENEVNCPTEIYKPGFPLVDNYKKIALTTSKNLSAIKIQLQAAHHLI